MKLILLLFLAFIHFGSNGQDSLKKKITPHHIKVQYAGGIGFLSVGTGYRFLRDKMEVDLFAGYVPQFQGSESLEILSLKWTWFAAKRQYLSRAFYVDPFYLGLLGSYTHADNLILDLSTKYPKGYYGWTTAVRTGIFGGFRSGFDLGNGKELAVYTEAGANEISVISYTINREAMKPWDILNLAVGLQMRFR